MPHRDPTASRLLIALTHASDPEMARIVLDRLDLDTPFAADTLLGAVVEAVARRLTDADRTVTIRLNGAAVHGSVTAGVLDIAEGTPAWEDVTDQIAQGAGQLTATRETDEGVLERLAWDVDGGWAWPAAHPAAGAVAGPQLWQAALEDQRDEQRRTNRARTVGTFVLQFVFATIPSGPATLRIVDAGPDRVYRLDRDDAGVHIEAEPQAMQTEAALVGNPIAFGDGSVLLVLHTGDEQAESAELCAWRVTSEGVAALDEHEVKAELAPHWFDRHHGLTYVAAAPIQVPTNL